MSDLINEAMAIRELNANVIEAADLGTYAVEYALANWRVFPLRGKIPAVPNPHPKGSRQRQACKGECGLHGHGVLDATTDTSQVLAWWSGRYAGCNIGLRVPPNMFVLDMDPRNGGLDSLAALTRRYGGLPETLTTLTGRGDGGWHRFYRRPAGKLSAARLGPGIDIKTSAGYVVGAPSIHPETGKPYQRLDHPVSVPPTWLVSLITGTTHEPSERTHLTQRTELPRRYAGESIAETFNTDTSWSDVLPPHGWSCLDSDPDADGARWRHPTATSPWSATVRDGRLYVYSPNTPFDVTEAGNARGYSRFEAHAVLNHQGDMSATARTLDQQPR